MQSETEKMHQFFNKTQEQMQQNCNKLKDRLLKNSPVVKFMMEQLEKAGCPFNQNHFLCTPCDLSRSGGFSPDHGILLCQNRIINKTHLQDTLVHELIHAFDYCTTHMKHLNCQHIACTEIRASMLSGECKFTREFMRGHFNISKQLQHCVKRRALLSLQMVPYCQANAQETLNQVFDSCFKDTTPFDEIY
jgi:inner membrane protease ATP23